MILMFEFVNECREVIGRDAKEVVANESGKITACPAVQLTSPVRPLVA